jgi:hypothetical protein
MVNIFAYRPTIVIARKDTSFTDCGVSVANTLRIVKIGEPFLSYYPARDVNGITGFEKDAAYFYFASQNIDLEGIADNQIPADLQITPGTNVFSNRAFAGIALQTVDFASVGFDASNLLYIYKVGDPYISYAPLNDINALSGFEMGEAYYGYALADMDLSDYLIPPIVVSSDVEQSSPGNDLYFGTNDTGDKGWYPTRVRFYADEASLPVTGEENIIYVAKAENTSSYWDGAAYQPIGGGGGGGSTPTLLQVLMAGNIGKGRIDLTTGSGFSSTGDVGYLALGNASAGPPEYHIKVVPWGDLFLGASGGATGGVIVSPDGSLTLNSGVSYRTDSKTANYTATAADYTILTDATAGAITISLPDASSLSGKTYIIKKTDSSANAVTIDPNGSQTIDGAATYTLAAQYKYVTVQAYGGNWLIIGNN